MFLRSSRDLTSGRAETLREPAKLPGDGIKALYVHDTKYECASVQ